MNYHQGDILLRRIDKIPEGAKKIREEIVAFGEVTGHIHQIKNAIVYGLGDLEFVDVCEPNPMTHNTHPSTDVVEIGHYEKTRQHEYFPEGELEVKD